MITGTYHSVTNTRVPSALAQSSCWQCLRGSVKAVAHNKAQQGPGKAL